jgi:hypothetical protein
MYRLSFTPFRRFGCSLITARALRPYMDLGGGEGGKGGVRLWGLENAKKN